MGLQSHSASEVALMIIQHMSTVPGISQHELTFERWEPAIGVLLTWTMEGPRTSKILVRVSPGTNHGLVIEALHGKYFSWPPGTNSRTQLTPPGTVRNPRRFGRNTDTVYAEVVNNTAETRLALAVSIVPARITSQETCLALVSLQEGHSRPADKNRLPLRRRQ
jgi:hypothetical protein